MATMNVRKIIVLVFIACLYVGHAFALDPSRTLTQYGHTAWRVRDGYFSQAPLAIAQTTDGQLWLGGEGGLIRFDGVQFSPWKPPEGQALPDDRIYGLFGASDGSLWIGTGKGLAQWKNNSLVVHAKLGRFSSLLEDRLGTEWAGHTRDLVLLPPLCRFSNNEFKCFAFSPDSAMSWVGALREDHQGDLWIGTGGGVCHRMGTGETNCYLIPAPKSSQAAIGVQYMAIDSDDTLRVDGGASGVWQLKAGQWKHDDEFPELRLPFRSALLDREGGLWVGVQNHGIIRHSAGRIDQFDRSDGLSGEMVTSIFEDREGSVWTATAAGLDRFRDLKVATISPREGLPLSDVNAIVASADGRLWIAGGSTLVRAEADKSFYEVIRGLPQNGDFGAAFEDSQGRLWLGIGHALGWWKKGEFHKFPSLELHQAGERVRAISEDVQGDIWVATTDPKFALVCISGGRLLTSFTYAQFGQQVSAIAPNPAGGVWVSRALAPGLLLVHGTTFEALANGFPYSVANMFSDTQGLWASTAKGLANFYNGSVNVLSTKNGLPCENLDAAIKDNSGAFWLRGTCGLMQIPGSELDLWLKDPSRRVQFRYLDAFDGAEAGTSAFAKVAKTADGRIWFSLEGIGVQVVDPRRLQGNTIPPSIAITGLVADHRQYGLGSSLLLPALTRDLEIDYTAYSLMVPEKVRFRYRLEGVDKSWQDVGGRRQAYFSNLKPGDYRFDVKASNNDGVWNEQGAAIGFNIAPAYYQTNWFRALCVAGFLALLWGIYQFRVQELRREFNIGLEARVNERTRIARDLHDTLLQTLHGLMFRFQAARNMFASRPEEAMAALDGAIVRTEQAIAESRDAIKDLRVERSASNDLRQLLTVTGQELESTAHENGTRPTFQLIVTGDQRDISSEIEDEVYRIGRELLRNAFQHSQAHHIEAEIRYDDRALILLVRDDGKGIDPLVVKEGGRPGHWGLPGVRERAKQIQADVDFWAENLAGTEVQLRVPSAVADKDGGDKSRFKVFRREKVS
jgi:signal transduction histidine kinase/ligand-binding sensor domain-containing protein